MTRRQLVVGLGATGLGLAMLAWFAANGMLRHPTAAAEHATLGEFLAIGAAIALLVGGIVTAYVAFAAESLEP